MFIRLVRRVASLGVVSCLATAFISSDWPLIALARANQVLHDVLDHSVLLLVPEDAVGSDGLDCTVHLGLVDVIRVAREGGQRLDRADDRVGVAAGGPAPWSAHR